MTDVCKVCKKKFVKMTASHFKTHGIMTWDEYNAIGSEIIEPVVPEVKATKPSITGVFCGTCKEEIGKNERFFFANGVAYHNRRQCFHSAR